MDLIYIETCFFISLILLVTYPCYYLKSNKILLPVESTTEKLVASFQVALYRQQQANPDKKLYSPEEMETFSDEHSPGLYQQILNCITREKTSTNRRNLQQQRAVSLMHILAYFR